MLFAEIDAATAATMWGAIMTAVTTVGGIVMLYLRQRDKAEIRRQERQKEFREEVARQKEREVVEQAAEKASIKKAANEIYARWKEIAETFKDEKIALQKLYETKCAECVELRIHLEEARKQIAGEPHE